jgi:hypothetical protein
LGPNAPPISTTNSDGFSEKSKFQKIAAKIGCSAGSKTSEPKSGSKRTEPAENWNGKF